MLSFSPSTLLRMETDIVLRVSELVLRKFSNSPPISILEISC